MNAFLRVLFQETPFYSAKMHYDEYPTHVWNASDMSDVEEIFDAVSEDPQRVPYEFLLQL